MVWFYQKGVNRNKLGQKNWTNKLEQTNLNKQNWPFQKKRQTRDREWIENPSKNQASFTIRNGLV